MAAVDVERERGWWPSGWGRAGSGVLVEGAPGVVVAFGLGSSGAGGDHREESASRANSGLRSRMAITVARNLESRPDAAC